MIDWNQCCGTDPDTNGSDPYHKWFGSGSWLQKVLIRIRITKFLIRILIKKGLDPDHKRFGSGSWSQMVWIRIQKVWISVAWTETQVLKNPPGRMSDSWVNGRGVYRKISQSKGGSTHLDFWSHHAGLKTSVHISQWESGEDSVSMETFVAILKCPHEVL